MCACALLSFYPPWDQIMQSEPITGSLIERAPLFSSETPLSPLQWQRMTQTKKRARSRKPRPSFLCIALCNYHLMPLVDLETSVSRCPFFSSLAADSNASQSEIKTDSLFIIVYLAPEQGGKRSRPTPQASGSTGPRHWRAVFAAADSKDQSGLDYIQPASHLQAVKCSCLRERESVSVHELQTECIELLHCTSMSFCKPALPEHLLRALF